MKKSAFAKAKVIAILLALCLAVTGAKCLQDHTVLRRATEDAMALHAAAIESDLEYASSQVYAFRSLIVGANGDTVNLQRMGSVLSREEVDRFVSSVLLAPDGYVQQVIPAAGNEDILGMNLMQGSFEDLETLYKIQKTEEGVLARHHTMNSGKSIIIVQLPVFLPTDTQAYDFWGIVAVNIAFPELLDNLRTDVLAERNYVYRILQLEENGSQILLTNHGLEGQRHMLSLDFQLAGQNMRIEAAPATGWLDADGIVLFFLEGLLIGLFLGTALEVSLKKLRALLAGANTDTLTGLMNRAAGVKEVEQIIQSKSFHYGAFLMLDIDNFKLVNDRLGHQRGDDVLASCAQSFRQLFRQRDVVCRLGGDEFVIFLPYAGDDAFLKGKVEKLLHLMRRAVVDEKHVVPISASVGVAIAPQHGTTFETLYQHADTALYRAKAMGRNCAAFYEDTLVVDGAQSGPTNIADRKTILIVDDDFINREIIKNVFSGHFRFAEAEDGQKGLEKVEELEADLCAILLDVKMPVMDGMQMLRALHERGVPAYIPVFMITAHDGEGVSEDAYKMGVVDVVSKPIVPEVIRRRVQTVIELYQARDMLKRHLRQESPEEE